MRAHYALLLGVNVLIWGVFCTPLSAQTTNIRRVKGSHTMRLPDDMSRGRAEQLALDYARLDALAQAFGTELQGGIFTHLDDDTRRQVSGTQVNIARLVNGRWLEDLRKNINWDTRTGPTGLEFWLTVSVTGRAAPRERKAFPLSYQALRCPEASCATSRFVPGENLLMRVEATQAGYLQIFALVDDSVYRMLPYLQDPASSYALHADSSHLLFSPASATDIADAFTFTEVTDPVVYRLFLLCAPTAWESPQVAAAQSLGHGIRPAGQPRDPFYAWLTQTLVAHADLDLYTLDLEVLPH